MPGNDGKGGVGSHGETKAPMNPTAIAVMLGIAVGAISLLVFAIIDGHPLLLASMGPGERMVENVR